MTERHDDDYLWDRSGTPDPAVQRLEELLSPLGHRGDPPMLRRESRRSLVSRAIRPALAVAATLVVGVFVWFGWGVWRGGWSVQATAGTPVIDGQSLDGSGLLKRGGRLVTDGSSRARIDVGRIGRVDVDPDTRLQLVNAGGRDHRLSLERGTIHARISAPPRFFSVNTPSAEAIDLGCAYTLQVDDHGAGLLRVTHGWVQFAYGGRESFIPQGAVGTTRPGVGPGTPYYEDAPAGYPHALATIDYEAVETAGRAAAFDLVVREARRRDALTLWHLLSRGSAAERARVFDRLAGLAPPPREATREAVLSGDRAALMAWWDDLSFEGTRWWQRLKKK